MLTIEVVRIGAQAVPVQAAAALHLNLPNDCFNGCQRRLITAQGSHHLHAGESDGIVALNSRWAQVAPRLGVIGLSGGTTLAVDRSRQRRGGAYRSLHVEEITWASWQGTRRAAAGATVLDAAWMVRSGGSAEDTAHCAGLNSAPVREVVGDGRAIAVTLPDGRRFVVALNCSAEALVLPGMAGCDIVGGPAERSPAGDFYLSGYAAVLLEGR